MKHLLTVCLLSKFADQYQICPLFTKHTCNESVQHIHLNEFNSAGAVFYLKCLIRHGFFFYAQKDREDITIHMRNSAMQLLPFGSISYATTMLLFWLR